MIFGESLPGWQKFIAVASLPATTALMLARLVVAMVGGNHSAAAAGNSIRVCNRHRAQVFRFLARQGWSKNWLTLQQATQLLLERVLSEKGIWIANFDQTYTSTAGACVENTFRRANKNNRSKKGNRHQKKSPSLRNHCFVFGLLISPETGTRIPIVRSYYTQEYCLQQAAKKQKPASKAKATPSATKEANQATTPVDKPHKKLSSKPSKRKRQVATMKCHRQKLNKGKNKTSKTPRKKKELVPGFLTQTDIAAEMIVALRVPEDSMVIVLGDTAFEAEQIRAACQKRNFKWITPANPERVLAGETNRRKLTDKSKDLSSDKMTHIKLSPDQTAWRNHLRGSKSKAGREKYARQYWAHSETLDVHNVGQVKVVFSTKEKPKTGQPVKVQKILLSNLTDWTTEQLVAAYSVRWQIEVFFKEIKSYLGLSTYRFRSFREVEGWVQACCIAFVYLEWYRLGIPVEKRPKEWWRLRTRGLVQLVLQEIEWNDLRCVADKMASPEGQAWLRAQLANALPKELRPAA